MILSGTADAGAPMSGLVIVLYFGVIIAFFYFIMIRPQKKEQKRLNSMLSVMKIGDTVMTTGGFYGIIIDIDEEDSTVIVEFGNNKNCRIPMNKSAIAQVESVNS